MSQSLGIPFLGEIPVESLVSDGGDIGIPVVQSHFQAHSTRAFKEIAGKLASQLSILSSGSEGKLFNIDCTWENLSPEIPYAPSINKVINATAIQTMIRPVRVNKTTQGEIQILWSSKEVDIWSPRELRMHCPCAGCIDEWSGVKLVKESSIPIELVPVQIKTVGRYAIQFLWSDTHQTGIYSYDYLYRLRHQ